jgi:hypothetical protein
MILLARRDNPLGRFRVVAGFRVLVPLALPTWLCPIATDLASSAAIGKLLKVLD